MGADCSVHSAYTARLARTAALHHRQQLGSHHSLVPASGMSPFDHVILCRYQCFVRHTEGVNVDHAD